MIRSDVRPCKGSARNFCPGLSRLPPLWQEFKEIHGMNHCNKGSATETALRLLAQRSLSEVELRQRLQRREYAAEAIDAAVQAMQGYNYLNDAKLAESVALAAERRGKGPRWIHSTLRRRGIAAPLAEKASVVDKST